VALTGCSSSLVTLNHRLNERTVLEEWRLVSSRFLLFLQGFVSYVDIDFAHRYHSAMEERSRAQDGSGSASEWQNRVRDFGGQQFVVEVVRRSFAVIMEIYERAESSSISKSDGSPLSEADLAAAALIERELASTGIPVICEESDTASQAAGSLFWLVDPLDGTKEFLARNGEFTVNVALIADGVPVVGVIGIPVSGEIYMAARGHGAYRTANGITTQIRNERSTKELIAAVSRSHRSSGDERWLQAFGVRETVSCGSSIKFCRVAEGRADIYGRFGRTMEWDTAAGHCLLNEAGCKLLVATTGEELRYGKPQYANPSFIACRADVPWVPIIEISSAA
jgi:3'(2'), 5'-bisphosphate nucleotidase